MITDSVKLNAGNEFAYVRASNIIITQDLENI